MNNYSFIVDGGLHISARAESEKVARARIEQSYPRAKITLKGVNLESAERGIIKPLASMSSTSKAKVKRHDEYTPVRKPKVPKEDKFDGLGMSEMEKSLVSAFV